MKKPPLIRCSFYKNEIKQHVKWMFTGNVVSCIGGRMYIGYAIITPMFIFNVFFRQKNKSPYIFDSKTIIKWSKKNE
jgi:hypothetical protein